MAKRKKRAATAWNRTFGNIAKTCFTHASTMGGNSANSYGKCMKDELKAASRGGGKIRRRKKR
jgi:hypothetical protein